MAKNPGFVLIHGAWHGAATWNKLLPLLRARGFIAESIDLPGAGKNALWPSF